MTRKPILNLSEFQEFTQNHSGLAVIDFFATWCGPCKIMNPIFEKLSQEESLEKFAFLKIDRDENQELIQKYKFEIPSIPRFFLVSVFEGNLDIIQDLGGTQSRTQLLEKIKKYITDDIKSENIVEVSTHSQAHRVGIIGTGPAGLTAALYTARANLDVTVFTGSMPGGQLTTTTEIENFPGVWDKNTKSGIYGSELVENIQLQAEHFGAKVEFAQITDLQYEMLEGKPRFTLSDDSQKHYDFDSVIIASGAKARYIGIEGEEKYIGKGYHSCATCDGSFYKNQVVAIVGGGDSAMEEANFLTNFASKVYLLHRSSKFRASQIMLGRARKNPKIEIITNVKVDQLIGTENLNSIVLRNTSDKPNPDLETKNFQKIYGDDYKLEVSALFVAIGHDPNTTFVKNLLETDEAGYLIPQSRLPTDQRTSKYQMATRIPGLFVAGDVEDYEYRQAITAAAGGCRAAMEAEKWLASVY